MENANGEGVRLRRRGVTDDAKQLHGGEGTAATEVTRASAPLDVPHAVESTDTELHEEAECWICRDTTSTEKNPLLGNICHCSGTIGHVHRECIESWMESEGRMTCPSCLTHYNTVLECERAYPYPETTTSKVQIIAFHFLLPALGKLFVLTVLFSIEWAMVPLIIAIPFYAERSWWSVPSQGVSDSTAGNQSRRGDSAASYTSSSPLGFHVLVNMWLFGFLHVSAMRSVTSLYVRWQAFFRDRYSGIGSGVEPLAYDAELDADDDDDSNDATTATPAGSAVAGSNQHNEHNDANVGNALDRPDGDGVAVNGGAALAGLAPLPDSQQTEGQAHAESEAPVHAGEPTADEEWEDVPEEDRNAEEREEDEGDEEEEDEEDEEEDEGNDEDGFDNERGVKAVGLPRRAFNALDNRILQTLQGGKFFVRLGKELVLGASFASVIRTPLGVLALFSAALIVSVYMRVTCAKKRILSARRRFDIVAERCLRSPDQLTDKERKTYFVLFITQVTLFSTVLPLVGGVVLHYCTSPFFRAYPPSPRELLSSLTMVRLTAYWIVGTLLAMLLMEVESYLVVPLFAPGVDLFFVRSVDLHFDIEPMYFDVVMSQVYDLDPLLLLWEFARASLQELVALFFFVAVPVWTAFAVRERLFQDVSGGRAGGIALPHPLGFPLSFGPSASSRTVSAKTTAAEWMLHQQAGLLLRAPLLNTALSRGAAECVSSSSCVADFTMSVATRAAGALRVALPGVEDGSELPATVLALLVAGVLNDTTVYNRLYPLVQRGASAGLWELGKVFWRSGYFCPAFLFHGVPSSAAQTVPDVASLLAETFVRVEFNPPTARHEQRTELAREGDRVPSSAAVDTVFNREETAVTEVSDPSFDSAIGCSVAVAMGLTKHIPVVRALAPWVVRNTLADAPVVLMVVDIWLGLLMLTVTCCLSRFPIQRALLSALRPCTVWVGERVFGLGEYLFDKERLQVLDTFLADPERVELEMPWLPPQFIIVRRSRLMPKNKLPRFLWWRVVGFSLFFFLFGCMVLWWVPVTLFVGLLTIPVPTVPALTLLSCAVFLVWSPTMFLECLLFSLVLWVMAIAMIVAEVAAWLEGVTLNSLADDTWKCVSGAKLIIVPLDTMKDETP